MTNYGQALTRTQGSENLMSVDRVAFALLNASISEADQLILRRRGSIVELQLRGGNYNRLSVVLRKRQ